MTNLNYLSTAKVAVYNKFWYTKNLSKNRYITPSTKCRHTTTRGAVKEINFAIRLTKS